MYTSFTATCLDKAIFLLLNVQHQCPLKQNSIVLTEVKSQWNSARSVKDAVIW